VSYENGFFEEKPKYIKTTAGSVQLWSSVGLIPILIGSLFMDWFFVAGVDGSNFGLKAFSTGFDFWIILTIVGIGGSILLSIKNPSRWGAVILAWFGSWWFLLSTASLTAREVFVEGVSLVYQIPELLQKYDIPLIGSIKTYAFDVGAAWYVILCCSILMVAGSIAILVKADRETRAVI
jgi:hypothetical protein